VVQPYGHYEKGPVTLLLQEQETIIQFSMSSDYIVNLQGENFPQFLPVGEVYFENNFNLSLDFYLVRPPMKTAFNPDLVN